MELFSVFLMVILIVFIATLIRLMRQTGFQINENNSLSQMLTDKCIVCQKHEANRVNDQNDKIRNRKEKQNLEVKFIGSLNETDSETMEEVQNSSGTEYEEEERESEKESEYDCGEDAEEVFVEHERQERELEELEVLRVRHKNAGRRSVERKRGGLEGLHEEWCDIEVTSSTPHYHTGYGVGVKPFRPEY
ncbi:uncharacterized protein LOC124365160 [Homalodisca vitripennis]|uniref:uncharacterized protein LOC124365160 n=1 Tax=Homalodisca vitripennis TaxID=197043 RepID=UPI001EEC70AC|nr:uncharacterized protein LOC124365160 [Homalodisca vitripennis]